MKLSVVNPVGRRLWATPQLLVVAFLLVTATSLIIGHRIYQGGEVELAGALLRLFTSSGVYVDVARQDVYFGLTSAEPLGLQMTPECTSAFLILPLVVIAAVLITLRPNITPRVMFSLVTATVTLIAVNQLRIMNLVFLVHWLGTDRGYYWGHTLLGSLVSVLGGAAALVLFVWLATRAPRGRHRA
jgi:exosortase/archaeosortase family protein